jgi:NitT/TauT family transport system permease protein
MITRWILPAASFVVALLVWELVSDSGWVAAYILPAPSVIATELYQSRELILSHTYITTMEIVLGFALAVVLGIGLATLLVYVPIIEPVVYPWLVVSQVIPKVAIAPLLLMWLGFGLLPKVIIAFLVAFFPVLVDTMIGLRSVEREPIYLLQSMGAKEGRCFWYVRFPTALPHIFGGMKVAITLAAVGAIVAEFVGSNTGLGYLLLFANGNVNAPLLFAALFVISALALLLYWTVSAAEGIFLGWHISHRSS